MELKKILFGIMGMLCFVAASKADTPMQYWVAYCCGASSSNPWTGGNQQGANPYEDSDAKTAADKLCSNNYQWQVTNAGSYCKATGAAGPSGSYSGVVLNGNLFYCQGTCGGHPGIISLFTGSLTNYTPSTCPTGSVTIGANCDCKSGAKNGVEYWYNSTTNTCDPVRVEQQGTWSPAIYFCDGNGANCTASNSTYGSVTSGEYTTDAVARQVRAQVCLSTSTFSNGTSNHNTAISLPVPASSTVPSSGNGAVSFWSFQNLASGNGAMTLNAVGNYAYLYTTSPNGVGWVTDSNWKNGTQICGTMQYQY